MDISAAAGNLADGLDDLGVRGLLEYVAAGPRFKGLSYVTGVVLHRQDENARLGSCLQHCRHSFYSALLRHDEVHEHNVGLRFDRLEHGTVGIGSLPDSLDVGLGVQKAP